MDNAVIVGYGVVGKATGKALGIKNYYDITDSTVAYEDIPNFEYIFICLPTPTINGEQDTDIIGKYVKYIADKNKNAIIIIRSTVLPMTCRILGERYRAKIVHVPEFLTEETWEKDAVWPDVIIIGADDQTLSLKVFGLFKARFKGSEIITTDLVTAEMIKYSVNCFYGLKVIYANSIYDFAQTIGANYDTIKKAMYMRAWIGKNHLDVWHKGGRGVAGKCLGKDLDAFATLSGLELLNLASDLNKELVKAYPKK